MRRRVELYLAPNIKECDEVKEFLEQQDLHLTVRDISSNPLNELEISKLIRHFNLKHFLDSSSKAWIKNKLEESLPDRQEIITLLADDNNDLLKKPIIIAGRLMVVGANRHKIMEMLQIKSNGNDPSKENELDKNRKEEK